MRPGKYRLSALAVLQVLLILVGLGVVAKPGYRLARRRLAKCRSKYQWSRWKGAPQEADASGSPAAWMKVPSAGIDTLVLSGASKGNLHRLPCMMRVEDGVRMRIVLAHRDTHFMGLSEVELEDDILLELEDNTEKAYRIVETEVLTPEQLDERFVKAGKEDMLVLVTCYPFRWIGPAPQRFVVWAVPTIPVKG